MLESYQIELRHLMYFRTVAEELHFRKAAERLHIAQPGLSRQIKQLEASLGLRLLIRDKRSVRLTEAGKYLLEEISFVQGHLEQAFQTAKFIDQGEEGEVRIGFVGSAMHQVIPDLLKRMSQTYPSIHTRLDQLGNEEQIADILQDKLDIGFIRSQQVPEGIARMEVLKEYFALVVPRDHHLDEASFQQIGQLQGESFILFSRDYSYDYYQLVMSIFEDQGFSPRVVHRSVHPSTVFRLVENGLGVAIVPNSLQYGFSLDIRFIPLDQISQRTVLSAIWKKENRNPVLPKFLGLLKEKGNS